MRPIILILLVQADARIKEFRNKNNRKLRHDVIGPDESVDMMMAMIIEVTLAYWKEHRRLLHAPERGFHLPESK